MSNYWAGVFSKLEDEKTMAQAYGDVGPVTPPPIHKPVLVIEAKSFPDAAKLAFRTMTYGELIVIAEELINVGIDSPTVQIAMERRLWRWANEDTNS